MKAENKVENQKTKTQKLKPETPLKAIKLNSPTDFGTRTNYQSIFHF